LQEENGKAESNATLDVVMDANDEPGSENTISITVWSKDGNLLFSTNLDGMQTVLQGLDRGNLRVH